MTGVDPVSHDDVVRRLQELGAEFELVDCDPELSDTAQFCEAYGYRLEEAANAILVASKRPPGKYAVCLVLGHTRLDVNHRVKREMGVSRLSFATPEVTRQVTGMEIGGVTPFGLPAELPILVDEKVMHCAQITLGAGSRSAKIRCTPDNLLKIPGLKVVGLSMDPVP